VTVIRPLTHKIPSSDGVKASTRGSLTVANVNPVPLDRVARFPGPGAGPAGRQGQPLVTARFDAPAPLPAP